MEYTPWTLLVDAGLIGLLLVVGALLRATIKPLQTMLIPSSVIAGVLGLVLGPNVLGVLPFSDQLGTYGGILIIAVFACLALTDEFNIFKVGRSIAGFASYGMLMYALQVALGMALVLAVLGPLLGTPDSTGLLLFAGWAGGFGTAAAVGQVFTEAGDSAVNSLAYTSATVGLLVGIVGGIIQAKIGAKRGWVQEYKGYSKLPKDMQTGVLDTQTERPRVGTHTFSGGSIETLAFQVGFIAAICAGAYGINVLLQMAFPEISFPLFSIAFVIGLLIRPLLTATKAMRLVDKESLRSISGTATDLLVVCGIASIVPGVVADQWLSLLILFLFGLAFCLFLGLVIAPRVMQQGWFERQLFTWGWSTGAVPTGIALLRIVDPRLRTRTLEDFALAFIPVVPIEITAVTFAPFLVLAGASWAVVGIWGAVAVFAALIAVYLYATRNRAAQSG
ncbi:sodium/glutamate symporter [Gulosibacter sp. 10]|uniref:sodium/glutamate symporter n=1 Tax=Gulosibacter sp. 10 TaxID=1255570 RepID=UPI00097F1483|nr:sodium:glutamate symporter [Gulosibacter sp. 10]SJM61940.1 Sodium/glutamate symporter [Gulosibacter sp. 10]